MFYYILFRGMKLVGLCKKFLSQQRFFGGGDNNNNIDGKGIFERRGILHFETPSEF